ncbi:TetR/AcrR family transcriptional regulator [Lysinibacillus parviboronicapiens]|uniref:TetR/AcrR family transcriptional regulator n=1 Tax=Lysinibacillus parviboronicapiens TaxID=436516 RepID=UPI000D36C227|nr:TetR/AcrR family transcriptional regulator [Lysinibacillus parviboronicapiens]
MRKNTADKILASALTLMTERGYNNVSVKEIALTAGVSEMTVFRHFDTKLGILQSLIRTYSYIPYFEHFFSHELTGHLTKDLQQIAHSYLAFMEKNKPIFLIAMQDRSILPELIDIISDNNTRQLQNLLADYFQKSIEQGHLKKEIDTAGQAIVFLTGLFGFFVSTAIWENHFLKDQQEIFVQHTVEAFLKGVQV